MIREVLCPIVILGCLSAASCGANPPTENIVSKLDSLALLGENAEPSFSDSVAVLIERNSAEVAKLLLPRLSDTSLYERQKAIYVWAIGLTKDTGTAHAVIDLHRQAKTEELRSNCLRALTQVGGAQAGEYLITLHDSESDKEKQFGILNFLSQMQYEPALTRVGVILKQDPKESYWQPIFIFGKMGDRAVPFLLEKINDKDKNVRANVINILGQWLIPTEAAVPLQDRYWVEKDAELRGIILSSLERTMTDMDSLKAFFEQVVAREKDKSLVEFARETLGTLDQLKAVIRSHAQTKKVSPENFMREHTRLFRSSGLDGDYEILASSSTFDDETKLKALREQILQRNSDEAFYDYQKVSEIIIYNRLAERSK